MTLPCIFCLQPCEPKGPEPIVAFHESCYEAARGRWFAERSDRRKREGNA